MISARCIHCQALLSGADFDYTCDEICITCYNKAQRNIAPGENLPTPNEPEKKAPKGE